MFIAIDLNASSHLSSCGIKFAVYSAHLQRFHRTLQHRLIFIYLFMLSPTDRSAADEILSDSPGQKRDSCRVWRPLGANGKRFVGFGLEKILEKGFPPWGAGVR